MHSRNLCLAWKSAIQRNSRVIAKVYIGADIIPRRYKLIFSFERISISNQPSVTDYSATPLSSAAGFNS